MTKDEVSRRAFMRTGSAAAAAAMAGVALPAKAASEPRIKWRLVSSFPTTLDVIHGGIELIARRVKELTDGKFEISVFPAGEIVPGYQVLDAVQQGTTECGVTCGFYYLGKLPALVFDTCLPFGMTPRQQDAWMNYGGGLELMRELYGQFGVLQFPCGGTGAQMGGWFRSEIKSAGDLKGLRIRTPGFVSEVYARLGAVPQQIAHSDVYSSLEKGTLDAVEIIGPHDDEKLGLWKAAKFYYSPGVLELDAQLSFIVNKSRWDGLPPTYQAAVAVASAEARTKMIAKYDAVNIAALRRLLANGVKLRYWPEDVVKAMYKATVDLLQEKSQADPLFAKVHKQWDDFRAGQSLWSSINDGAAEHYVMAFAKQSGK
ncbi:ABC transporter substrate-binding protein [Castellaniella sp. GW247-6E4]|uniref:TRAP transporter substrate-binding protein n=1 Tax=Castellaniella sp. GW247-6E4 TaxID=3140380 RepID=UPI0033156D98